MNSKTKNITGWVLAGLVAFVFVGSGILKLMGGTPEMVKGLGGINNVTLLGGLELIIAALFLFPRTGVVGSLLAIAYMGGAMAVHLTTGQSLIMLVVIQILIWITSVVRFPELGQQLFNRA
ncbi:MAG: DoxX family protein [Cytophagaceae bacterium]|nr:DoxX family protein [Cytophagaceae bacterium]MBK9510403.1 DoxX family protein [Cytophagaceae bacterium]MBK9936001.1 DoxX family protein [Cytophagaceae bacterium]MBL0304113.1 DoxX family protein [Cytophagaceae bacterium]MBL0326923.1 DoxX family protein [Cytophagaceae bacterium]